MPFTCGSRYHIRPDQVDVDHWITLPNGDRTCSYCGSLHSEDFTRLMEDPEVRTRPAQRNKLYVLQPNVVEPSQGGIKFYAWHVESEQAQQAYQRAMRGTPGKH